MSSRRFFIKDSFHLSRDLLRVQIIPLATLFVLSAISAIFAQDQLFELGKTEDSQRWILQIGLAVTDLATGLATLIVLSWGVAKARRLNESHYMQQPFHDSYIGSFLAEYFRMLASVLLWGLALILPGMVRYCRLIFVPFVTLFVRPYREGKIDAFALAIQLTRGRMLQISTTLLLTTGLQIGLEFLPQLSSALHSWPVRFACLGLGFYVSVWLFAFLFLQFDRALIEHDWPKN